MIPFRCPFEGEVSDPTAPVGMAIRPHYGGFNGDALSLRTSRWKIITATTSTTWKDIIMGRLYLGTFHSHAAFSMGASTLATTTTNARMHKP